MVNYEQLEQQSDQLELPTEPAVGEVLYVDTRTGRNIVRTLGHSAAVHSSFEALDPTTITIPYLDN